MNFHEHQRLNFGQINKAYGLVEALIALVIIAVTMISALKTVSSSLKQVKDNETEDKANEIMTSALEYAYGYDNIDLPFSLSDKGFLNLTPSQICLYYTSTFNIENGGTTLNERLGSGCDPSNIVNDLNKDNYKVVYDNNTVETETIYHQVIFTNTDNSGATLVNKIRVTSIVLYQQEGKTVRQTVDAYRPLYF